MNLDINALTQMVFSVGVSWYLLVVNSKKLEEITKGLTDLAHLIQNSQKESLDEAEAVKEMFVELKSLIKETSQLVHNTSESVRIQNELTKTTLERLERMEAK